jgi:hypothetical protein
MDGILVLLHVPAGVVAVATGACAMLAGKGSRWHRRHGLAYLSALAVVCLTGTGLAITRWPRFPHLLVLAMLAGACALVGYLARHRPRPAVHLLAMSGSYVVMLTAFYVDNGPKLPLWRLLPPSAFWWLPSLVALPLVARALRRYAGGPRIETVPKG